MITYILLPYLIPFFFVLATLVKSYDEASLRKITSLTLLIPFFATLLLIGFYVLNGSYSIEIDLFQIPLGHHHFSVNLYIDELTLVILFLTGYLSYLVGKFSHSYLHRERGYQRFFRTIHLFIFGLEILALAGSLDLFFMGWEIIGLSSFLLIAFYRDRTKPVKNAFRIFAIYRICDVGLLVSAVVSHIFWHNADHFKELLMGGKEIQAMLSSSSISILGLLLFFAALGKSAQFPFLNWPARAMEGPTPSSAIFYGALSIHCGVFLLYRTYPIWSHSMLVKIVIVAISLLTIFLATLIGRVQSNIKGQIAYASVSNISIILIELVFGLKVLVLVHVIVHCLFRCYQILTSPSSVVDHVQVLDTNVLKNKPWGSFLPEKLRMTLFSFAMQEAYLSNTERGIFIFPAYKIKIWARNILSSYFALLFPIGITITLSLLRKEAEWHLCVAYFFACMAVFFSLKSLVSLKHPSFIWNMFLAMQVCLSLSYLFFNLEAWHGLFFYLISVIPCWILGKMGLRNFEDIEMTKFNGLYVTAPRNFLFFMIAFIGVSGFPFTTSFWGEDLILGELFKESMILCILFGFLMMMNGLISARILVKTFWGFPSRINY